MKLATACLTIAILCPAVSIAYPTDMSVNAKGLDIEAIPTLLDQATVIRLVNNESFPVRCDLQFSNGPEISRVRKVTVESHDDHIVRFTPSRVVIRLRVDVNCWPADKDDEPK
jgi:hypothetical protein